MARKAFLHFIFNRNKKPLYEDDNGFIQEGNEDFLKPNGEDAHLKNSPDNWSNTTVTFARNIKYWGLNRTMTTAMKFSGDALKCIKHILWGEGYNGVAYFAVMKLNRYLLPYVYEAWYMSELNFVKFKQDKSGASVEALEGGMSKILKAFENTKYEIDVDSDPEKKFIYADGINLVGRQTMLFGNMDLDRLTSSFAFFFFMLFPEATEGQSTGITIVASNYNNNDLTYPNDKAFLFGDPTLSAPILLEIEGVLKVKLKIKRTQTHFRAQITKSNEDTPFPLTEYDIYNTTTGSIPFTFEGETRDIPYSFTIPIAAKDRLFIKGEIDIGGPGDESAWEILEDSRMIIKFKNKYKPTNVPGLYLYRVFEKIVEQMIKNQVLLPTSDGTYFKSDWLKNKKDIIITGGDNVRGLAGGKIVTSLSDLFKSLFGHYGAVLGEENGRIFIEPMGYGFREDQDLIDLGELEGAELECAEDLLFNKIKVGGPVIEYGDVNGKSEFTQEQSWSTPVSKDSKELDLTTPWRRDPFGFELLRISLIGKDTTDNQSDKTVFMINVQEASEVIDGVTVQRLFRPTYTTLTGVPDPDSIFNVELSPATSLLNLKSFIDSIMDLPLDGGLLTMDNAEKNRELSRTGYSNIDEDEDKQIGGVARIFRPFYLTGNTVIPKNALPTISATPYGKIKFTVKLRPYVSWLMDGKVKPELNDKQNWKMLSHWSNDLSKFNE